MEPAAFRMMGMILPNVFRVGTKMGKHNLLKSAFTASLLATAVAASPSYALEAKQCLSMADMNAALKAEGQRTMIIGDRVAINDAPEKKSGVRFTRYVNTVTANADGSLGYQLEGDLPRAQASTNVCVRAKLTNVRLYDARRDAIPQAAYLGGQFDVVVNENAAKGTRPMMVASTVHSGADGSKRIGLPLVVFGHMQSRTGSISTKLPDGQAQFLVGMEDTDYTPAGLAKLNPQVAMCTPN